MWGGVDVVVFFDGFGVICCVGYIVVEVVGVVGVGDIV